MEIGRERPTQSVIIPYKASKGGEAAALYALSGRTPMKWQTELLKDIMAQNDDGLWTHARFGFAVPRRNGKTEDIYMREMWGLIAGEKILHTAHRTSTSHSSWEALLYLLECAKIPITHTYKANGREHIWVHGGGRIEYRTRTAKGGLGEGYDLLVIDEAQEYQDDQETALKYIVTASNNPQTIMMGTPPTAVSSGTVFKNYRDSVLAGDTEDAGWAEWSVPAMTDPKDRDAWYMTNPSLGQLLKERSIKAEITDDPVDFNIQRLGLWLRYEQKSAISAAEWNLLQDKTQTPVGNLFVGIKYGKSGDNVCMAVAVKTGGGKTFVEAIGCKSIREGNDWIIRFIAKSKPAAVVVDGAGQQTLLAEELKTEKIKPAPILPTVKEICESSALFERMLSDGTLCHAGQEGLAKSVTNCEHRAIGSNGGFGYKSLHDNIEIALLESVVLANWACATQKKKGPQQVSY